MRALTLALSSVKQQLNRPTSDTVRSSEGNANTDRVLVYLLLNIVGVKSDERQTNNTSHTNSDNSQLVVTARKLVRKYSVINTHEYGVKRHEFLHVP